MHEYCALHWERARYSSLTLGHAALVHTGKGALLPGRMGLLASSPFDAMVALGSWRCRNRPRVAVVVLMCGRQ